MRASSPRRAALILGAALTILSVYRYPAGAFVVREEPPAGRLQMNLSLPTTPFTTRGYGVKSWSDLARDALGEWNHIGVGVGRDHAFFSVRTPTVSGDACARDGVNHVTFAPSFCGLAWGDVIAITLSRTIGGRAVEVEVIFNQVARDRQMDAYPGPIVRAADGSPLLDFYRLALHEFGHAAGLQHPNDSGQVVTAIMNAGVNQAIGAAVDHLQGDDVAGAHSIAWGDAAAAIDGSGLPAFVRRFYGNVLGRTPADSEVAAWVAFLQAQPNSAGAATLVHAFFDGAESLGRPRTVVGYVNLLYTAILGRTPAAAETAAWTPHVLARRNLLIAGFVGSPEFTDLASRTPVAVIITRLYQEVLGRNPAPSEVAGWVDAVAAIGDWQIIAQGFLNSPEYLDQPRTYADHVERLYRAFLGRSPAPAETGGWVGFLVGQLAAIEDQFIASAEFQAQLRTLFTP